jgi:hypothetical protein
MLSESPKSSDSVVLNPEQISGRADSMTEYILRL